MKSTLVAYILWLLCFVGLAGIHRIYAGKVGTGILWLVTFGLFGIGQLIDLLLIPGMIVNANLRNAAFGNRNTNVNNVVVNVMQPTTPAK